MELLFNRHHVAYERRWYKTPTDRTFRNHPRLIVPMWTCVHNELHAEAGPAKKPEKYSILGALALVDDMVRATPAELVEELGHYFVDLGEPMGANLLIQAEYIAEGEYRG